jgi:hypothetical protein
MADPAPAETEIYYEQDANFGGPKNLRINGQGVHAESIKIYHAMNDFSKVTIVFNGCKVIKGQES